MPKQSEAGYYAVIPADVRYSKDISSSAKLMYGEITALAQKEGYCWASNKYFADLYGVSTNSVSKWVNELVNAGFVDVKIERGVSRKLAIAHPKKREGSTRKVGGGVQEKLEGSTRKVGGGSPKKVGHNNTSTNNTTNNTSIKNIPATCYALAELLKEQVLAMYPNNASAKHEKAVERWAVDIDKAMRIDGRTEDELRACILWAFQKSDFWHRQIWSGANLRKHFDKMYAQARFDSTSKSALKKRVVDARKLTDQQIMEMDRLRKSGATIQST